MASNEEIVRAAYHAAEGSVMDLEGWRTSFTEDGVFNMIPTGESYTGEKLNDVVTFIAGAFPDVHRELLRVNAMGDNVVAVELLIQGTFLGPWPTPAGPLAPNGAKTSVPTADFLYLRDGKIQTFNCYPSLNIRLAQMGVYFDFASAVQKSAATALQDRAGPPGPDHRDAVTADHRAKVMTAGRSPPLTTRIHLQKLDRSSICQPRCQVSDHDSTNWTDHDRT